MLFPKLKTNTIDQSSLPKQKKYSPKRLFIFFLLLLILILIFALIIFTLFNKKTTDVYNKAPIFITTNSNSFNIYYPDQQKSTPITSDKSKLDQFIATDLNHFFYIEEGTLFSKKQTSKSKKIDSEVLDILTTSVNGKSALFITEKNTVNYYTGGKSIKLYDINPTYNYEVTHYKNAVFNSTGKLLLYIDYNSTPFTLKKTTNGKKSDILLDNVGSTLEYFHFNDQLILLLNNNSVSTLYLCDAKGNLTTLDICDFFDPTTIHPELNLFYFLNAKNELICYKEGILTTIGKDISQFQRFSNFNAQAKRPDDLFIHFNSGAVALYNSTQNTLIPFLNSLNGYTLADFDPNLMIIVLTKSADQEPVIYQYKKESWQETETNLSLIQYVQIAPTGKTLLLSDVNNNLFVYTLGSKKEPIKIGSWNTESIIYANSNYTKGIILDDDLDLKYFSGKKILEISTNFAQYFISKEDRSDYESQFFPIPIIDQLTYFGISSEGNLIFGKDGKEPKIIPSSTPIDFYINYTNALSYALINNQLALINPQKGILKQFSIEGDTLESIDNFIQK